MLEAVIDDLLEERISAPTRADTLTKEEKKTVIRGLALRKRQPEILDDLAVQWKEEGREAPSSNMSALITYYKKQYIELIEECAKLYQDQAVKNWRLSDKFTRVRILDRLGNMADDWLVEHKKMFYNSKQFPQFKARALFLMKILELLNREMGSVRIVKKEVVHKKEITLADLVGLAGDPQTRKSVEAAIARDYGERLGISDAEVLER